MATAVTLPPSSVPGIVADTTKGYLSDYNHDNFPIYSNCGGERADGPDRCERGVRERQARARTHAGNAHAGRSLNRLCLPLLLPARVYTFTPSKTQLLDIMLCECKLGAAELLLLLPAAAFARCLLLLLSPAARRSYCRCR